MNVPIGDNAVLGISLFRVGGRFNQL